MAERVDDLNRRGLKIIQDTELNRFGTDSVLLTGFAKIKKSWTVLDLGTGAGVIPLLLCAKTEAEHITGIEIQKALASLAERSAALNGLSGRITVINGDINDIDELIKPASFDAVTANPPYVRKGAGVLNESESDILARHEAAIDTRGVVRAAARSLKYGGRFYMVHRPERLAEIFRIFNEYNFEMKTLRFVQAYAGKKPKAALIEAALNGKPQLTVMPPLIMYERPGAYSDEMNAIYNG